MKTLLDPRHSARKHALTQIFSWAFTDTDIEACEQLTTEVLNIPNIDTQLVNNIVSGVQKNLEEIDAQIAKNAPEWPLDKISKVDLVILRIAIYEILYTQTPKRVIVDEAVELAKEFGNDTSPKFINGVLGSIIEKQQ